MKEINKNIGVSKTRHFFIWSLQLNKIYIYYIVKLLCFNLWLHFLLQKKKNVNTELNLISPLEKLKVPVAQNTYKEKIELQFSKESNQKKLLQQKVKLKILQV